MFLVIAIVGTTIAPWQLFFQQSAIADKRLRFSHLRFSRLDTFIGACITITAAGAMMLVGDAAARHGITYDDRQVDDLPPPGGCTAPGAGR